MSETVVVKQGTLGSFAPAVEETQVAEAEQITTVEPQVETAQAEVVPQEGTQEQAETAPENEASFSFNAETPAETTTQAEVKTEQATDWKEVLKNVDKKEAAKVLGLNDFALELNDYLENGGSAEDYLKAKAFNWDNVSHRDLVLLDLKSKYPTLSEDKLNRLFETEYSQSEFASEDDKEVGAIKMEADAERIRLAKKQEQSKFQLPEPKQVQQPQINQAEIEAQNQAALEQARQYYLNHEVTQSLFNSKKVAVNVGEYGTFNFKVDKPEELIRVITDADVWQKVTSTPQGEPDVAKLQRIALAAVNPNYERDLINYGKSLGIKSLLEEGQNAIRNPRPTPPMSNVTEAEAWKNARAGKLGA